MPTLEKSTGVRRLAPRHRPAPTPAFISRPRQQGRLSAGLPARAARTAHKAIVTRQVGAGPASARGAAPGAQRLERGPSGTRKTPKVDPYNDSQFQDVSTMVGSRR